MRDYNEWDSIITANVDVLSAGRIAMKNFVPCFNYAVDAKQPHTRTPFTFMRNIARKVLFIQEIVLHKVSYNTRDSSKKCDWGQCDARRTNLRAIATRRRR